MKAKEIAKFLLLSLICIVIASMFCIALFHTSVFANIKVLMYRGIALIFITGVLLFVVLLIISKKHVHICDIKDALCITIMFLSLNMVFFTLVPVTVERSVSVFTLAQIEELASDTVTKSGTEKIFNDIFISKNDAFGKRFNEQVVTGTIKENSDGSYTLTNFGHILVQFFRFIGRLYNADCKNLY